MTQLRYLEALLIFPFLLYSNVNNQENPHMRRIVDRHQTFIESENWPGERIEVAQTLMADVGIYYLVDSELVQCWYCNGGLKN